MQSEMRKALERKYKQLIVEKNEYFFNYLVCGIIFTIFIFFPITNQVFNFSFYSKQFDGILFFIAILAISYSFFILKTPDRYDSAFVRIYNAINELETNPTDLKYKKRAVDQLKKAIKHLKDYSYDENELPIWYKKTTAETRELLNNVKNRIIPSILKEEEFPIMYLEKLANAFIAEPDNYLENLNDQLGSLTEVKSDIQYREYLTNLPSTRKGKIIVSIVVGPSVLLGVTYLFSFLTQQIYWDMVKNQQYTIIGSFAAITLCLLFLNHLYPQTK
jgi:hypothetical protein